MSIDINEVVRATKVRIEEIDECGSPEAPTTLLMAVSEVKRLLEEIDDLRQQVAIQSMSENPFERRLALMD